MWNELLQKCFEWLGSPNALLRRTCFLVLNGCPQLLTKQDAATLKPAFLAGVQDADIDVRLDALRASVMYLCECKASVRNELSDLLPLILNVCICDFFSLCDLSKFGF